MYNPKAILLEYANQIGFHDIGFARAQPLNIEIEHFLKWIDKGYNADMNYLDKNFNKRLEVTSILPSARTIIVTATNYYSLPKNSGQSIPENHGKLSRYAWGEDYHEVLIGRLAKLSEKIKELFPNAECAESVDTSSVMEKQWAVRSGIGWQGRNSLIISRKFGSWIFLGTVITSAEFEPNKLINDYCGTCKRCMVACPTGAIVKPGVIDANKCISYWTIEAKSYKEIPDEVAKSMGKCLYGCDICQEACPWNKKLQKVTDECRFHPRYNETYLSLQKMSQMNPLEFSVRFKRSPIKRIKVDGLKRNIRAITKNNPQK